MPVPYYPDEPWEVVHKRMKDGKLHMILQSPWDEQRVARFKFGFELGVDPDKRGPLSANERISYEIGELLGLPVRPIQFYTYHGLRGHLAWAVTQTAKPWSLLDQMIKRDPARFLSQQDILQRMFVFDLFIYNHDRHEGNVLVTERSYYGAHDVSLIDHDLALFGTYGKWRTHRWWSPAWNDPGIFIRIPEVKGQISRFEQLESAVEEIESLPGSKLDAIVDGVRELEDDYLTHFEAHTIKQMLSRRQETLRDTLRQWCMSEALF
ncbi:MAG: hypothetical protein Q8P31_05110 [Bacillota bacterium]|nr:hypothetical protein [Bacillota bacterium]